MYYLALLARDSGLNQQSRIEATDYTSTLLPVLTRCAGAIGGRVQKTPGHEKNSASVDQFSHLDVLWKFFILSFHWASQSPEQSWRESRAGGMQSKIKQLIQSNALKTGRPSGRRLSVWTQWRSFVVRGSCGLVRLAANQSVVPEQTGSIGFFMFLLSKVSDVILKKRNFKIADEEHPLCEYLIDMNVVFSDFECAQRLMET